MTVHFDPWALTLAALMAGLVSHTTLTLSLRIAVSSQACALFFLARRKPQKPKSVK
jgi:hypothetical protein